MNRNRECSIDEVVLEPRVCCTQVVCTEGTPSVRWAVCGCGHGVTETLGQRIYSDQFRQPYAWERT